MKKWYESRTIWVGIVSILIAVLGLVATFLEAGNFTAPAIVLLVSGVLQIVLRYMTEMPIA